MVAYKKNSFVLGCERLLCGSLRLHRPDNPEYLGECDPFFNNASFKV
jgi:hypothetical protein